MASLPASDGAQRHAAPESRYTIFAGTLSNGMLMRAVQHERCYRGALVQPCKANAPPALGDCSAAPEQQGRHCGLLMEGPCGALLTLQAI